MPNGKKTKTYEEILKGLDEQPTAPQSSPFLEAAQEPKEDIPWWKKWMYQVGEAEQAQRELETVGAIGTAEWGLKGLEYALKPARMAGAVTKATFKPETEAGKVRQQLREQMEAELDKIPTTDPQARVELRRGFEDIILKSTPPAWEHMERFEAQPWYIQLAYELPFWTALAATGATAIGAREALKPITAQGGVKGAAAKAARLALEPIEAYERLATELMQPIAKLFGKIKYIKGEDKLLKGFRATKIYKSYHPALSGTKSGEALESRLFEAYKLYQTGQNETAQNILNQIIPFIKNKTGAPIPQAQALVPWKPTPGAPAPTVAPPAPTPVAPVPPVVAPGGLPAVVTPKPMITPAPVTPKVKPALPAPEARLIQIKATPIGQLKKEEVVEAGVRQTLDKFKKLKTGDLPLEYKTTIQEMIGGYDLNFRSPRTLRRREATMAYVESLRAAGLSVEVPEKVLGLASLTPLRDMTPEQVEMLYGEVERLVKLGSLKNKLIQVQVGREVSQLANELVTQLGELPPPPVAITETALKKGFLARQKEKAQGILERTYRAERILLDLDGYDETGLFLQTFYKPINTATDGELRGMFGTLEDFRGVLKANDIDLKTILTGKIEYAPGIVLTPAERIGVYLHSLNPDNLLHVVYGNKISEELVNRIVNDLAPGEKIIADWLHTHFESQGAGVSKVRTQVEGTSLDLVKDYFPIELEWRANPPVNFEQQMARDLSARFTAKWASSKIPKGFLRDRSHKAMQPVNLNALDVFLNQLKLVEHYKTFAPVVRDLQRILNDPEFKNGIIAKKGKATWQVLDTWLKAVAGANPLAVTNTAERVMRTLRVNGVATVLGYNLVTALKQFPSFSNAMAEVGIIPVLEGAWAVIKHPVGVAQQIKKLSPQVYHRSFEREVAEAKLMRSLEKRITNKISPKETAMLLTVGMDRFVVNSTWKGAFDDFLAKHPGMETEAAEYAERGIRRTQPIFSTKDLAEFYRSGEAMKGLTIFTNQLNENWNYYNFDIYGKAKAGKINFAQVVKKTILALIIPGILIGWFSRSRPAKNVEEFTKDVVTQALAAVPLVGTFISSAMRGYSESSGVITLELFSSIQKEAFHINKGEWLKALQDVPELVGYATGIPVAQPKRFTEAMIDLAQKNSDDWMSLIWGKYTRQKALRAEINYLASKWKGDFEPYEKLVTRNEKTDYRELFPKVDARLFIVGTTTTLLTLGAEREALALIKQYNIPTKLIRGYEKEFGGGEPTPEEAPTPIVPQGKTKTYQEILEGLK